jgi:hypothetical protein
MDAQSCPRCGGRQREAGRLQGQHRVGFRPDRRRLFTLRPRVRLSAAMCRACGHVELTGDREQLRGMLREGS